jgi:hypothetical protein
MPFSQCYLYVAYTNSGDLLLCTKSKLIKVVLLFQLIRLNAEGQIGIGERCVEADKSSVKLIFCPMGKVDGPWEYDEVNIF